MISRLISDKQVMGNYHAQKTTHKHVVTNKKAAGSGVKLRYLILM